MQLDDIDQRIIALLSADARASYAEIGSRVSLSAPAVKRRVDRLRAAGVIRGFTAVVDPAAVGWTTEAFVELFCTGRTTPAQIAVAARRHPEVVGAYTVSGEADALVHLRAADIAAPRAGAGAAARGAVRHLDPQHDRAVPPGRSESARPPGARPPTVAGAGARPSAASTGVERAGDRRAPAVPPRWPPPPLAGCTADAGTVDPRRAARRRTAWSPFDSCEHGARRPRGPRPRPSSDRTGSAARRWSTRGGRRRGGHRPRAPAPTMPPARRPRPAGEQPSYSGTNTHEAGVDEPDLVKTDGRRIVTRHRRRRCGWSTRPRRTRSTGWTSTAIAGDGDCVGRATCCCTATTRWCSPAGTRAAARSPTAAGTTRPPARSTRRPELLLVDLAGTPRVLCRVRIDGSLVDARQVGTTARVVVRSAPRSTFPRTPERAPTPARPPANQAASTRPPIDAWLPRVRGDDRRRTTTGRVGCDRLSRPAELHRHHTC